MTPVFRHGRLRLYLLRLLDEEPRHGYEVIRLLRDRFMGVYAPSPGTIYPRLARLEDEGLVTHDEENGRKVYRITEAGREELRSRGAELDELEEELSESVSDIAREFGEDVRATVRSLREELTRAAREVRQSERDTARDAAEAAQLRVDAREQWNGGSNWSEWSHWADRPGRAHDLGALRDFERLARDFVTDLRSVAWDSSNVLGSEVIPALRDILADTLDRIRTEVLGPMNTSAPSSDKPPADESQPKDS